MSHIERSDRRQAQVPKRRIKPRSEIQRLREENRQLRELVVHLSKLAVTQITQAVETGEHSAPAEN